jgi:4-amino-4-deoxy-L-arabinose transferase-like glycosyltransferase
MLARMPAAIWIVLAWAIAVLPSLPVRSFIWEEGTNAELARDMLAHGNLLEPTVYGVRWAEKPSLLPWLIAAAARLTGGVDEWSARLPPMVAVLLTALLVQRLTRRYASMPASLFAAAAFMFCPLLLQKVTISEPDTIITVLSFAAFVVWWRGEEDGRVAGWRWLACGVLLAALVMAKGPQPAGFFALGAGGYLIARRRWSALPGLVLCLALPAAATIAWAAAVHRPGDMPVWLGYMRLRGGFDLLPYLRQRVRYAGGLPLELLPSTILLPSLLTPWWRRETVAATFPVITPLVLYAGPCTLALLLWPGAKTRYAMPAAPAVAALAGLAIDALWRRGYPLARAAGAIAAALFAYQVALVAVAMPLFAERFAANRQAGVAFDRAIGVAPAPVFTIGGPHTNQLFYVTRPIRRVDDPSGAAITAPAWLLAPSADVEQLTKQRPDLVARIVVVTSSGPGLVAARLERRSGE